MDTEYDGTLIDKREGSRGNHLIHEKLSSPESSDSREIIENRVKNSVLRTVCQPQVIYKQLTQLNRQIVCKNYIIKDSILIIK